MNCNTTATAAAGGNNNKCSAENVWTNEKKSIYSKSNDDSKITGMINRNPANGSYMTRLFYMRTSSRSTSTGNQPQIKSSSVLKRSAHALQNILSGQTPISYS